MKCSSNFASHYREREYIIFMGAYRCVRMYEWQTMCQECQTRIQFTTELIVCLGVSEH